MAFAKGAWKWESRHIAPCPGKAECGTTQRTCTQGCQLLQYAGDCLPGSFVTKDAKGPDPQGTRGLYSGTSTHHGRADLLQDPSWCFLHLAAEEKETCSFSSSRKMNH